MKDTTQKKPNNKDKWNKDPEVKIWEIIQM